MTSTNVHVGFNEAKNSSKVLRPPGGGHSDIFGIRDSQNNGIITPSKRKNVSASTISSCFSMIDEEAKPIRNGSSPTTPEKANVLNGNGEVTPQKNGHAENGHQNGYTDENKSPAKQNGDLNGKTVTDGIKNGSPNGIMNGTPSRLKNKVPPGGFSSGLW